MTLAAARPVANGRSVPAQTARNPGYVRVFRAFFYSGLLLAAIFGSPVLRVAALCALPLALLSDWDGGLRHLVRIAGLTAMVCLAPGPGMALGRLLGPACKLSPALAPAVGVALLLLVILVVGMLLTRAISVALRRRPRVRAADHVLGMLVGTVEGAGAVVLGCWMLAALDGPIRSLRDCQPTNLPPAREWALAALSTAQDVVRTDPTAQWLVRQNPLESVPDIQTVRLAAEVAVEPQRLVSAVQGGQLDDIADLPEVRRHVEAIRADEALQEALARRDLLAVLGSPHLQRMLSDRELHGVLVEHRDEILAALDEASESAPPVRIVYPAAEPVFLDRPPTPGD